MKSIFYDCQRSIDAIGLTGLDPLRGSKVFITGGTGFVGSWLLATIAQLNDRAGFGIQATAFARHQGEFKKRAPFLAGRDDITLMQGDIRQLLDIPAGCNWVIHAAGVPDNRHHATNPIDTAAVIAEGTLRLFRLAERVENLRNILHFSSGLVGTPLREGRIGTSAVYTEAKAYSEALCAAFRSQARIPIVITRPFTFLGPFQALDAPWAVNNFLHAAVSGQPLKLLGNGEAARSYLYGSDMAILALHQLVRGKSGDTFDLGGVAPLPLIDLAKLVAASAKRPLEIRVNTGSRGSSSVGLVPNMRPSEVEFGFKPAFGPMEAVDRSFAWYSDHSLTNVF